MFRRYEDPHKVQEMLEKAERELERVKADGIEDNTDYYIDMVNEVESLKERVNFAWQDDEYDEMYAREMYGTDYNDEEE